ncbi:hypothetical protein HB779_06175 [Phyllobacterium sp. 628]|uniref:hypothetical protein n=1 Tax=Phyllobacterium sp. 628 TaxID=2718938 RepID=UPI0016626261|nr:hypothetical protein [Phyllobacterium sp. 628]QND51534.1 hypothetical protein HB779_06175 [Phyllobacterium sp. 628]
MENDVKAATAKPCPTANYLQRKAEFEKASRAGFEEAEMLAAEYLKGTPNNGD